MILSIYIIILLINKNNYYNNIYLLDILKFGTLL